MSYNPEFDKEVEDNIDSIGADSAFEKINREWMDRSLALKYSYNFSWLGRPIIQYPQDMVQVQELIWEVKPDLIIETGVAHGGSLILSASMLALLELADATTKNELLDPNQPKRKVIGIDIDIRDHNRRAISEHMLSNRIELIEGSSVDEKIIEQVKAAAKGFQKVLMFLDSNHTYQHVMDELNLYSPLVSSGSYCVVFDTIISDMPEELSNNRPWGKASNPLMAVHQFMQENDGFLLDENIDHKLKITAARNGFLKRKP